MGGVARYGYRLAENLAPLVDLTIITTEGGDPVSRARMEYLPRPKNRLDQYYGAAWRMRKAVAEGDYDVVHGFGEDWLLKKSGARFVRTFLGSAWQEARSSSGARRWNHYLLAAVEQISNRRADHTIGIGPESFDHFRCDSLMPPVTPIPNTPQRNPADNPTFIFIGSFQTRKRGFLVQNAVQSLREGAWPSAALTVVGPETDKANWADWVEHRSGLGDVDVQAAVATSWALVAPSTYEGFGIPTFEALHLGTPAVVTPNPGSLFLASIYGYDSPLTVVEDEAELAEALADRAKRGPHLDAANLLRAQEGTAKLLAMASAESLLRDIYLAGS